MREPTDYGQQSMQRGSRRRVKSGMYFILFYNSWLYATQLHPYFKSPFLLLYYALPVPLILMHNL